MTASNPDRDAWRALALVAAPGNSEFRVFPSDVSLEGRPVLYAVDHEGRYHLLVPVPAGTTIDPDRRSAGVHLSSRELDDKDGPASFLDVGCQKRHLHELFIHLADEMVQELRTAANPLTACRAVLGRWRELLNREPSSVLSEQALAGLYGELWHLRELARISPNALQSWVGPTGERHDFARGGTALEVKTTTRTDEQRYEIHGIDQLEPPLRGTLYLSTVLAEQTRAGGESLPDVITEIESLGVERLSLWSKLASAGYHRADEHHYGSSRFHLRTTSMYRVDESFPRIVRGSFPGGELPPRILHVSYVVDLTGSEGNAVPLGTTSEVFSSLAGA